MTGQLRILLVEDDDDDVVLTREYLDEAFGDRHSCDHVSSIPDALQVAATDHHDIYLVDFRLGADDGIDFIREVTHEMGLMVPIILLTGQDDLKTDMRSMEAGATDYLVKQNINAQSLERSIRHSIFQKKSEAKIKYLAEEAKHANEVKSKFLATMSHELRTPMAGVIGMADLLLDTDLSPQQLEWATSIKISGETLLTLLSEILDQSKLEAGKLEIAPIDFHLVSFVEDTIHLFSPKIAEKGLALDIEFGEDLPDGVNADRMRIGQVLSNLLSNALKFTESGAITVRIEYEPKDDGSFMLRISVTDSGIGLSIEAQDKLFSAFIQADSSTSRKYGGTGLGLSISKQLAELMGGEIGVESDYGKGSTFWFTTHCYPVTGKVEADDKRRSLDRWVSSQSLKVLVAEDNTINQQLIQAIFDKLGHEITIADNGRMVTELVESEIFDIILMDVRMPEMDGLEATAMIRSMDTEASNIPIIALTADIAAGNIKEYMDIGMNDVCFKPLDLPVLLKTINNLLGEEIHTSIPDARFAKSEPHEAVTEDALTDSANFSHILERVSNMVDQRTELERQDNAPAMDLDGLDEGLMAELSAQFAAGLIKRCDEMKTSVVDLLANPLNGDAKSLIKNTSHILKGQGGSFGYQLISTIATEIDDLLKEKEILKTEDIRNLSNCIESMSLIITKGISGHGGKAGRILLQGLKDNI